MTGGVGCPDENALVRFSMGQLSGTDLGGLEAHLDGCGACRSLIAQLSSGLTNLKQTGSPEAVVDAPVMRHGKVGRYQVERLVGGGGMGMVYAARDKELNRAVAIKLLRTSALANAESRSRLLREAQTMAKLSHPNLVPIFELGSDHGDDFLAMELIDGPTLDMWLRERKRDWREVVRIFIDAGRGLEAAHQAGVVHRDFKPGNVLVGPDGRARVTDFGLARPNVPLLGVGPEAGSIELTREGALLGTPAYMAPEQLEGQVADVRSDQFSFCVALAEALTGHRPFPGRTLEELRTAMRAAKPPVFEVASARLDRALRKGMAVLPEARFESMGALLAELELTLKPSRANPRAVAAAMALAVVLAAAAGVAWQQQAPARAEAVAPIGAPLKRTVNVTLGESKALALNGVQRIVSAGDLNVLQTRIVGNRQVELVGVSPGHTTLVLATRASPHEPIVQVEWEVVVADDAQELRFLVGAEQSLTVPGVTRVVSNDPAVLEVGEIQSTTFGLKALKAGNTRVIAFRGENSSPIQWKVTVSPAPVVLSAPPSKAKLSPPAEPAGAERKPMKLIVGRQKVLTVVGIQRVAVGDSAIADVKTIGNNQLLVIGVGEGVTTLLIWTSSRQRLEWDITVAMDSEGKTDPEPITDNDGIERKSLRLFAGGQLVLQYAGIQRVAVAEAAIADVKTIGNDQLLVIGAGQGTTTLIVWTVKGERLEWDVTVDANPGMAVQPGDDAATTIELAVGAERILDIPALTRVAVGDAKIADVKTFKNDKLVVKGVAPGRTTVLVWTSPTATAKAARTTWIVKVQ